jgi:hypothetical protein
MQRTLLHNLVPCVTRTVNFVLRQPEIIKMRPLTTVPKTTKNRSQKSGPMFKFEVSGFVIVVVVWVVSRSIVDIYTFNPNPKE